MSRLGPGREFDLIRTLLRGGGGRMPLIPGLRVPPGDDALVLDGDPPLVLSTDLTLEGTHFRRAWISLQEAVTRGILAALSDLAAMAAEPTGVLLSLALGPGDEEQVPALAQGIRLALDPFEVPLLGGDLARSPGPMVLDVVVLGRSPRPLTREGLVPGDELWVTGPLGGAAAAVAVWEAGEVPSPALRRAFTDPAPRIREMAWLRERVDLRAGLDLSDGLASDAWHLATASEAALEIEAESVPVHPALPVLGEPEGAQGREGTVAPAGGEGRLARALRGGEDYEVLFGAPPGQVQGGLAEYEETFGTSLHRVGTVAGSGAPEVWLAYDDGSRRPLPPEGFDHFRRGDDR